MFETDTESLNSVSTVFRCGIGTSVLLIIAIELELNSY